MPIKNGPCVITRYNVARAEPLQRIIVSMGELASSVTYTVPDGKYTSYTQQIADQLAQNDLDANGQNYAR